MKRLWQTCWVVAASATLAGTTHAQSGWNQSSEFGSYQSIVARGEYGNATRLPSQESVPSVPGEVADETAQRVAPVEPVQGCSSGNCGQSVVHGTSNCGCAGPCGCGSGRVREIGSRIKNAFGCSCGGEDCGGRRCGGRERGQLLPGRSHATTDSGVYAGELYTGHVAHDGVYSQTGGGRLGNFGDRLSRSFGNMFSSGPDSNAVLGIYGLYFTRDHEDDVRIARNGAGDVLLSTTSNHDSMGGIEVNLANRNCNGSGWEAGYWGLYPSTADSTLYGPGLDTYLTGLSDVRVAPAATDLQTYFNNSDNLRLYRDSDIHNAEFNLLRNGGQYQTRRGRCGNFELLGGFRWFQFNEEMRLHANYASANPSQVFYDVGVENTLIGFQLGGRSEICLSNRWNMTVGTKVGVFNNHIDHEQQIADSNGVLAYRTAGGVDDYVYMSDKNDLSMLGELELGLNYQLTQCSRFVIGYRAVGVSGIALAPNQIPTDFASDTEINAINSNGDLILGGGYAGIELSY